MASPAAVARTRPKKLQVSEFDGQNGSVITWLQQIDNVVEMAQAVNHEQWDENELYHAVGNKLTGKAAIWFVNMSVAMMQAKKNYSYLRYLLRMEYSEILEPDQVIAL